jgi:hypothetical protein
MRRETTVEIDGKEITVREMKTSDVIQLFESDEGVRLLVGIAAGLPSDTRKLIEKSLDLPAEQIADLFDGINNYSIIETKFREVNADFFVSLPRKIEELVSTGRKVVEETGQSLNQLVGSSRKAT